MDLGAQAHMKIPANSCLIILKNVFERTSLTCYDKKSEGVKIIKKLKHLYHDKITIVYHCYNNCILI